MLVPGGPEQKGLGPAHVLAAHGFATVGSALPVNPERLPGAGETAYLELVKSVEQKEQERADRIAAAEAKALADAGEKQKKKAKAEEEEPEEAAAEAKPKRGTKKEKAAGGGGVSKPRRGPRKVGG